MPFAAFGVLVLVMLSFRKKMRRGQTSVFAFWYIHRTSTQPNQKSSQLQWCQNSTTQGGIWTGLIHNRSKAATPWIGFAVLRHSFKKECLGTREVIQNYKFLRVNEWPLFYCRTKLPIPNHRAASLRYHSDLVTVMHQVQCTHWLKKVHRYVDSMTHNFRDKFCMLRT